MLKNLSLYGLFMLLAAAVMAAGCAQQDVVKKDEAIAPASAATQPESQKTAAGSSKVTQSADQQGQKASPFSQLQSALEKVYFDFDSAGLSESARSTLSKNAAALVKEPAAKVRIEGNCDERGSAEYNLALGERRAKSAQQYLINLGVKPDRLSTISYGKEKPAVQGSDEGARAKNRRDEFVVN